MLDRDEARGQLWTLKPVPFLDLRNDYKGVCRTVRLQESGGRGQTGEPNKIKEIFC